MNILVTLNIGDRAYIDHTRPLMELYAKKIKADYKCVDNSIVEEYYHNGRDNNQAYIIKCNVINNLLKHYNRVIYMDDTICVHPNTPNLFDIVPEKTMGAFNEGKLDKPCALSDREYILGKKKYEINSNNYINAGLLVVSRPQRYLFHSDNIKKHHCLLESPFVEQTYLNYMIQLHDTRMTFLSEPFNRMRVSHNEERHVDVDPEYVLHSGNVIYHITSWHGSQSRRLRHVRDVCDILKGCWN